MLVTWTTDGRSTGARPVRRGHPGTKGDPIRPSEKSLPHQIAAHSLHAKYDSRDLTANAHQAFLDKFERDVDPEGLLDPAERARRAKHARAAHMKRLALLSAKARRARKGTR